MNKEIKTFEDMYNIIDVVIKKRKHKWNLKSIVWFDFEDVEQIIKIHIYKKWHLWDQSRPIEPWLNRIVSNQIRNLIRNNYSSIARPCLSCPFNQSGESDFLGENSCGFTTSGLQCSECPLYAKWEKFKKPAFDVKITLSLDGHENQDIFYAYDLNTDYNKGENRLHSLMKENLSDRHFFIYKMFFIDNLSDEQVASILKFKTSEKNRKAGYKQIKNLKNMFYLKARQIVSENDLFM